MSEEWRAVPGYEGLYEVSDMGRVRSLTRTVPLRSSAKTIQGKMLGLRDFGPERHKRKAVTLYVNSVSKVRLVHQLVLEAFVGPRPEGMQGCHNNGQPFDNRPENLRWDTRSANALDSVRHGTHPEAKKTHCSNKHEYTPENTRLRGSKRVCRTCHRDRERERSRLKAAA